MVTRSFRCDPNRLRLLLNDQLPEESHAELAHHVETCAWCRRRLESLAAEARWWTEARQFLRPDASEDVPWTEAADAPESPASKAGPKEAAGRGVSLAFLAPSDDPEKLGRLGPYEIVEVIGSGGMGVVLKGFDGALNRYVAIKILSPHLAASAAARRRFAREAQAAAAIVHEHVVAIHAVDSHAGLPYLVMPLVPGRSLQERIHRTGPLGVKEILRIGMQAASGLAAAHAQGLVHRDVKPANILLENDVERVLITDFGLARAADDASLTQSGVLAGTPQYMAPEQAKGEGVGHRADLFSLGSVLYAMATGRSPFRAKTTMGVLRRICEGKPRPVRDVNPEIPDWLAEIIDKLHEKEAADRFESASELADLLGRHLAHLQHPSAVPMPGRVGSRSRRAARFRFPRRPLVIAAGLLLAVGGVVATETLGITAVGRFVATAVFGRDSEQAITPLPSAGTQAPQTQPDASAPALTVVPSDLLHWDDGLQDDIDRLQQHTEHIETSLSYQTNDHPPSGGPSNVDIQFDQLEQDLNDDWP